MRIVYIFLLILISLSMFNCNPKTLLGGSESKADVDSILFYQQTNLSDPFLDEINNNPGNEATLKAEIVPPPPPPPPDYREIEGFRIQVFAGTDSVNARAIKYQVTSDFDQPVYMVHDGGLYKVQAGDYPYRTDADNAKLQLNQKGFTGAWVVKRMIRVPLDTINTDTTQTEPVSIIQQADSISTKPSGAYRIQILVTSDEVRAKEVVFNLKKQFNGNAFYESAGNLFKVFIGYFENRAEADTFLSKVRTGGYPDAWLVY